MFKHALLTLILAATMSGCIHRTSSRLKMAPAFPVVTTLLPYGADAWVCESRNGDSFQVCDAVAIKDSTFTRVAFSIPRVVESLDGYLRVDQPNGLVVYWRARMMQ